jgi:hypothetical protein
LAESSKRRRIIIIMEASRRSNALLDLEDSFWLELGDLSNNEESFTIEQFIAALEATTTLTNLSVRFDEFVSTPENNRRFIEPLCRCIANLRRHNQNHPLRTLRFYNADNDDNVDQLLVAAKQFGIRHLEFIGVRLPIQSLVEFCRDNTHLKVLEIVHATLFDEDSSISVSPKDGPQDFSAILALDELTVSCVTFEKSNVATKFLNFIAHVTYPALALGEVIVRRGSKTTRLRIVSALIKPSVVQFTLRSGCRIEIMDVIAACATVTQIQLNEYNPPIYFTPAAEQRKLQAIATRNRELARFVANPIAYPRDDKLVALMSQFDNSPTGRYMLACCFPGMDSFFKIKSTDLSAARPKKRKRRY